MIRKILEALDEKEFTPRGDVLEPGPDPQLVEKLAKKFSLQLWASLADDEMKEVILLNREETDPGVCHSHDFVDANMVMEPAFTAVVGHEPDVSSEADTALWNAAWDMAKRNEFWQDLNKLNPYGKESDEGG